MQKVSFSGVLFSAGNPAVTGSDNEGRGLGRTEAVTESIDECCNRESVLRFAKILSWAEALFALVMIELFMGAITPVFFLSGQEFLTDEAKEAVRVLNLPFYAMLLLLVLPRLRGARILASMAANWHLAALFLLACISTLWSIAPDITARRCVAFFFTMLFGIYLAQRYDLSTILRLVAVACAVDIICSIVAIVFVPAVGVSPIDDRWRGIFGHKNSLGQMLLISLLVFSTIDVKSAAQRTLQFVAVAIALGFLWLTDSRGPFLSLLPLVPLAVLIWTSRFTFLAGVTLALPVLTVCLVGGVFAYLNADQIFDAIGKDSTLTGRTELWALVEEAISDRPWLGWGYAAFWETDASPSRTIWELIRWDAPGSHNGYMEMLLGLGVLGPTLLILSFAVNYKNAAVALWRGYIFEGRWCLFLLITLTIAAFNEDEPLVPNSILMVLYVVTTITAQRVVNPVRQRSRAPHLFPAVA
jgi:exopolysaccharide production protein ExoQ